MHKIDTQGIAKSLREYTQRTALRGGNPYRAKAYSCAADSLAALAVPLHVLIEENRLTEIPGVGEAIADIITKLHRTGTHPGLEKLRLFDPHTTVIGHMTGRHLQRRPGYEIDVEKVLRACVAVEINAIHGVSIWIGAGTRPRSISAAS